MLADCCLASSEFNCVINLIFFSATFLYALRHTDNEKFSQGYEKSIHFIIISHVLREKIKVNDTREKSGYIEEAESLFQLTWHFF